MVGDLKGAHTVLRDPSTEHAQHHLFLFPAGEGLAVVESLQDLRRCHVNTLAQRKDPLQEGA